LRSVGVDFNPSSVVEHAYFQDPLLVIGRPLVFDSSPCFAPATWSFPITTASPLFFSQPAKQIISNSITRQAGMIDVFIPTVSPATRLLLVRHCSTCRMAMLS
jgi:hypothetical protein